MFRMDVSDRYSRQVLFPEIGAEGQERLAEARVAVIGLGALGCPAASLLVRAGVGHVELVDRDVVERSNLQRQLLYTEADAEAGLPKAEAAAAALRAANRDVRIDAHVRDLSAANADALLGGVDVIVDGTDNFDVRFLVNDWAVRNGVPWVYAAAVGATGLTMPILPGRTACLRCLFEEPPPPGASATCDTAGVLGPVTAVVGSLAALEALKIAAGRDQAVRRGLLQLDLWQNDVRSVAVDGPRVDCPCCVRREFPYLTRRGGGTATSLCGRDAVQVSPGSERPFDYEGARERLARAYDVTDSGALLRFQVAELRVTLFRDGRALVHGTSDEGRARAVYARTIGT